MFASTKHARRFALLGFLILSLSLCSCAGESYWITEPVEEKPYDRLAELLEDDSSLTEVNRSLLKTMWSYRKGGFIFWDIGPYADITLEEFAAALKKLHGVRSLQVGKPSAKLVDEGFIQQVMLRGDGFDLYRVYWKDGLCYVVEYFDNFFFTLKCSREEAVAVFGAMKSFE